MPTYLEIHCTRLDSAVNQAWKIALAFPHITFYLRFNGVAVNVSDAENELQIIEEYTRDTQS